MEAGQFVTLVRVSGARYFYYLVVGVIFPKQDAGTASCVLFSIVKA